MTSRWNALIPSAAAFRARVLVRLGLGALAGSLGLGLGSSLGGCASELPPQLPSSDTQKRAATRVELVELVISDPVRAGKVRSLYVQIDDLMLSTKRRQADQLLELGSEQARSAEETRELFRRFREAEAGALKRYVGLQLEIRTLTTPEEFARLDAIE
ncbi:MAG TPA: hypothetical protein VGK73_34135 [Polyangiaceae bacterium]